MIETNIIIINKLGLHARAASKLVSCSSAFGSNIQIGYAEKMVDSKSIMSVMLLAAGQGSELLLLVDGHDEESAHAAVVELINDYFGEGE